MVQNFLTTVAILLEAGASVNAQTLGGETALMKVKAKDLKVFNQKRILVMKIQLCEQKVMLSDPEPLYCHIVFRRSYTFLLLFFVRLVRGEMQI